MAKKVQGGAKKENLDDLKQELDIDYHKITSEELYQRFQTHPENVSELINLFPCRLMVCKCVIFKLIPINRV